MIGHTLCYDRKNQIFFSVSKKSFRHHLFDRAKGLTPLTHFPRHCAPFSKKVTFPVKRIIYFPDKLRYDAINIARDKSCSIGRNKAAGRMNFEGDAVHEG